MNVIFFTLLLSKQPRFQSNVPENREQSAFQVKPNTVVVRWNIVGRVARSNKARDAPGGGVLAEKLGRGVRPTSQNPYPIYDQNLRFSLPYL